MIVNEKTPLVDLEALAKSLSNRWGEESDHIKEIRIVYPSGEERERAEQVYKDFETAVSLAKMYVKLATANAVRKAKKQSEKAENAYAKIASAAFEATKKPKTSSAPKEHKKSWGIFVEDVSPQVNKARASIEKAIIALNRGNRVNATHQLEHAFQDLTSYRGSHPDQKRDALTADVKKALRMIDQVWRDDQEIIDLLEDF